MAPRKIYVECALFDMDGTLVDTTSVVIKHWEEYALDHDLDVQEILKMSHGRSMLDTLTHWTPHYASPEIAEGYERKLAENANGVALAPGAANLHAAIPSSRFGMFTGAKSFTAEARLKQCHLDRPKSLITGDMVKHGKPDPEGWIRAAEILGYSGSQCVALEDSPVGIQAAKAAGMYTIACVTTNSYQSLKAAGADYIVQDLSQVEAKMTEDDQLEISILSCL